jgi:predicted RNA polymerase sigma factor
MGGTQPASRCDPARHPCATNEVGLDLLGRHGADERLAGDHRLPAVRGHLLEMSGDRRAARDAYRAAAERTTSVAQQRYLHARAARLAGDP